MKKLFVICATCGVGKSTVLDYLRESSDLKNYTFLDSDDMGVNWHEYKDLPNGSLLFSQDSLKIGVEKSEDKNLVWGTCMNPLTYKEFEPINEITEVYFINLICSNDELYTRLKGRPAERMTDSDEFINGQVEYMDWFRKNKDLMDLVIDSSSDTIEETAKQVEEFIRRIH